jgi:hypothetical protein
MISICKVKNEKFSHKLPHPKMSEAELPLNSELKHLIHNSRFDPMPLGAMVKALSFEVDGPKFVSGASKEFLEKNGYYIFHFSSKEKILEYKKIEMNYLLGLLATL